MGAAGGIGAARTHAPTLCALVVAAGVVDNGKLADLTPARWTGIPTVNLTGTFLCCRAGRRVRFALTGA